MLDRPELLQKRRHEIVQSSAGGREDDAVLANALEQLHPHLGLQSPHLLVNAGLCNRVRESASGPCISLHSGNPVESFESLQLNHIQLVIINRPTSSIG